MTDRDHLFLAYNQRTYGALSDAWLSPRLQRYSLHDPAYWASIGQLAERGLIDIVFSGDASAHANPTEGIAHDGLDRFTAWSALLEATEHPGFILTASTTYNDPFRLAERLLSLDHLSGGRLAWNVVTSHSQAAAANFGLDAHPDRTLRYARGEEFVGLVVDLWNSAITGEKVDHVSDQFHVQGRLRVPPSAQGRPPIIRASTSRDGADLQGRYANGVFAADLSRAAAVANRAQVRHDATRFGRPADDLTYLSGLRIVLGATEEEAQRKVGGGHAQTPERIAQQLDWFGRLIDHDLTTLDPDQPLPAELISETRVAGLPETGTTHGFRASVLGLVHEHLELPLRELITQLTFVGAGHSTFIGTPEHLADRLEDWFRAGAADGFVLAPDLTLDTLELLADVTVPALQRKGIFKHEYTSSTFAGHLGVEPAAALPTGRFIADIGARARARSEVVARLRDPRANDHAAPVPSGVASSLTVDALADVPDWVALTERALAQAIADPDRLAALPEGTVVVLGLGRASEAPAPEQALDPSSAAVALGLRLPSLRFVPVISIAREHPWNIERTFASLQHLLRGRTGVLLCTEDSLASPGREGASAWDPGTFAAPVETGLETLREAAHVVRRLGDSYPISSIVADKESGTYAVDQDIAPIEHEGPAYRVAGPSAVPSSPYGRGLIGVATAQEDLGDLGPDLDLVVSADGEAWAGALLARVVADLTELVPALR